jgi:unsaturated rhamnogalacturonyl hydrolase
MKLLRKLKPLLGCIALTSLMSSPIHQAKSPALSMSGSAGKAVSHARRLVLLDCYYNDEWRKDSTGNLVRYHYLWQDTTNSGYSQLAAIITKAGATVDTLCQAPTPDALERASIYIIVDPDTPKETQSPNYLEEPAIGVIDNWVRSGGVLVLLGNDKGNAEFEHFNQLAERFGVHFKEDSRNKVVGDDFQTGTFKKFPEHRLFAGVKRIFIKELSTLRVQKPAKAVFSEGGDNLMAFSRVGKGAVFAVGDPWFYNEYMDQRRLPPGYDNAKAADNLFRWLLHHPSHP